MGAQVSGKDDKKIKKATKKRQCFPPGVCFNFQESRSLLL